MKAVLSYRELGSVVLQSEETVLSSSQHYQGVIRRSPVDYNIGRLSSIPLGADFRCLTQPSIWILEFPLSQT